MFALEAFRVVPPPARCVPRQAWRNGSTLIGERTLAEEVPVAFSYDGATHAVLMATPDDFKDLRSVSPTPRGLFPRLLN